MCILYSLARIEQMHINVLSIFVCNKERYDRTVAQMTKQFAAVNPIPHFVSGRTSAGIPISLSSGSGTTRNVIFILSPGADDDCSDAQPSFALGLGEDGMEEDDVIPIVDAADFNFVNEEGELQVYIA